MIIITFAKEMFQLQYVYTVVLNFSNFMHILILAFFHSKSQLDIFLFLEFS
jgi:hypothetical protein